MKKIAALLVTLCSVPILCAEPTKEQNDVKPLTIDLTTNVKKSAPAPLGQGSFVNSDGISLSADNRSFFLNGKPWIPVAGEFHYARYPRQEWREELLKMKAGGINTVSTYVFWIHHEEIQGKYDWSGQRSLRDFLKTVQEVGLKVIVRIGPWDHGEVRNGGFPDWLQTSKLSLRSTNPEYLNYVKELFREEAAQMKGLLWKDGGPVIGVQLENECSRSDYLLELKKMAIEEGIDVPLYEITGWQGGIPKEGLLPLFGGYPDGFWGGSRESYRKEFLFNELRSLNDLGAQLTNLNPSNKELIEQFPYACVEIGGGMMSSYNHRIKILPDWIASLALSKLGSGNNMPGYYMYQGGVNPEGLLSNLQEDHPNKMPLKDYDFQTAISSCGQIRRQYHLLRMQHLFLEDFGEALARMPAYFPDQKPKDLKDFDTLRWSIRADEKGQGFLFFNNLQPYESLPEHKDIRFEVKTFAGTLLLPDRPISIPSGAYGIWPINLDCQGVILDYATVQPLCHISGTADSEVYFFSAIPGIRPELKFKGEDAHEVTPGEGIVINKTTPHAKKVSFVVLKPEQARALYRLPFAGRERVFLSSAALYADNSDLKFQSDSTSDRAILIYPELPKMKVDGAILSSSKDGVFSRFSLPITSHVADSVSAILKKPAIPLTGPNMGYDEGTWMNAAEYQLDIPESILDRHPVLDIHYQGDAARLYLGKKLFMDHFSNGLSDGDPMSIALWRIPKEDLHRIRLLILPRYSNQPVSNTDAPVVKLLDLETMTISPSL